MAKDLRPVYTAPAQASAIARFGEFTERWAARWKPALNAFALTFEGCRVSA